MICFISSIYCPWHTFDFKFQMNCIIYSICDSIEIFSSVGTRLASQLSFHPQNQMQLNISRCIHAFDSHLIQPAQYSKGIHFYFQMTLDDERKEQQGLLSFIAERGSYKCHWTLSNNPKTSKAQSWCGTDSKSKDESKEKVQFVFIRYLKYEF